MLAFDNGASMASYKLNIATIRSCPPAEQVGKALESFGLPDNEPFGVLNYSATEKAVFATIIRKTQQTVQRLNPENPRELTSVAVEKVNVYPFCIRPESETLEIYNGSATGIEQVSNFLAGCLSLPTIVEAIELDLPAAIQKLTERTKKFQLISIRISEYAHNSYMSGPYVPKFLDSVHGQDFLDEYIDYVKTAKVKFYSQTSRVTVNLTPQTCYSFSCNEDDLEEVRSILRKL